MRFSVVASSLLIAGASAHHRHRGGWNWWGPRPSTTVQPVEPTAAPETPIIIPTPVELPGSTFITPEPTTFITKTTTLITTETVDPAPVETVVPPVEEPPVEEPPVEEPPVEEPPVEEPPVEEPPVEEPPVEEPPVEEPPVEAPVEEPVEQPVEEPVVEAPVEAPSGLNPDQQAALDAHNAARAEVGNAPLVWDAGLSADAQSWADHLASNGIFEHSGYAGQGENLYMQSNSDNPLLNGANAFISEKASYNGEVITGDNFMNFGHYTQVVWKDTTNVGMAVAVGPSGSYVVMRYTAPGNMIGSAPY